MQSNNPSTVTDYDNMSNDELILIKNGVHAILQKRLDVLSDEFGILNAKVNYPNINHLVNDDE